MVARRILYGYQICNGEVIVIPERAEVVKRIYQAYLAGASYESIANELNRNNIPFDGEIPVWQLDKVRRVLTSEGYAGSKGYPVIIDHETFEAVRAMRAAKTAGQVRCKRTALKVKKYLRCEHCGGNVQGYGTGAIKCRPDTLYLKCYGCGIRIEIDDDELLSEINRQLTEHYAPAETLYRESEKVVRLTNAINRGLEKPSDPDEVINLILQGVSARYDCWPSTEKLNPDNYRVEERSWDNIGRAVSRINIAADKTITVYFKD